MSIKKEKKYKFEKDLFFCGSCSKTFNLYFLTEQYGYLSLTCNKCTKVAYVNCFEDDEFQKIYKKYEKKYPNFKNMDSDDRVSLKFNKEFENTCDPCKCGGKYIFDDDDRCPHCLSDNIEELRIKEELEFIEMIPNWVTHKKMKKNEWFFLVCLI